MLQPSGECVIVTEEYSRHGVYNEISFSKIFKNVVICIVWGVIIPRAELERAVEVVLLLICREDAHTYETS